MEKKTQEYATTNQPIQYFHTNLKPQSQSSVSYKEPLKIDHFYTLHITLLVNMLPNLTSVFHLVIWPVSPCADFQETSQTVPVTCSAV